MMRGGWPRRRHAAPAQCGQGGPGALRPAGSRAERVPAASQALHDAARTAEAAGGTEAHEPMPRASRQHAGGRAAPWGRSVPGPACRAAARPPPARPGRARRASRCRRPRPAGRARRVVCPCAPACPAASASPTSRCAHGDLRGIKMGLHGVPGCAATPHGDAAGLVQAAVARWPQPCPAHRDYCQTLAAAMGSRAVQARAAQPGAGRGPRLTTVP